MSGIYIGNDIISNLNFVCIVILVFSLLGSIMMIVGYYLYKKRIALNGGKKILNIGSKIFKEYLFLIVYFASTDIGFNLGLQLLYGKTSILSFISLAIGIIIAAICVIVYLFDFSE